MGETGCGKTRLIRFMCDLTARGCKDGGSHVTNMLIMKVRYFILYTYDVIVYFKLRFMVVLLKVMLLKRLKKLKRLQLKIEVIMKLIQFCFLMKLIQVMLLV